MSAISDKYAELGGGNSVLGNPTSAEADTAVDGGRYRHDQNGSIFSHKNTGAHEVHGRIHEKWGKIKAERGPLGFPTSDESDCNGVPDSKYNLFERGSITWKQGADEAFETHGAIRDKFCDMGCEAGTLGFPTTDESPCGDKKGRFNHFENGSIYWKPSIGIHEVHGLIHNYWRDNNWEYNPDLGYPISDETLPHGDSQDRFSDFENGVVYWKHGTPAAFSFQKLPVSADGKGSQTADMVVPGIKQLVRDQLKKWRFRSWTPCPGVHRKVLSKILPERA